MITINFNGTSHTLQKNIYLKPENLSFTLIIELDLLVTNRLYLELNDNLTSFFLVFPKVKDQLEEIKIKIGDYIENTEWDFSADPINWEMIKEELFHQISGDLYSIYQFHIETEKMYINNAVNIETAIENIKEFEKEHTKLLKPTSIEITGKLILKKISK